MDWVFNHVKILFILLGTVTALYLYKKNLPLYVRYILCI